MAEQHLPCALFAYPTPNSTFLEALVIDWPISSRGSSLAHEGSLAQDGQGLLTARPTLSQQMEAAARSLPILKGVGQPLVPT